MPSYSKGFTLVELIVVIILISVLAVYAIPKLGDTNEDKAWAFKDLVMARLHLIQEKNMTFDGNSCSLLVVTEDKIGEVEVSDCYTSASVSIVGTVFDESDYGVKKIEVKNTEVSSGKIAIIGFDHNGDVRGCLVVNKGGTVTLERSDCQIRIGDMTDIRISVVGGIY